MVLLQNKVHIPDTAFRYAYCAAPRLPAALATHFNDYFDPHTPITGEDIKVAAAATALHDILAYSLCAPGEGILTSKPHYGGFVLDFELKAGVKLIAAETDHETCFDEGVVAFFEERLRTSREEGVVVKAVLIVNPHNPLGWLKKCVWEMKN